MRRARLTPLLMALPLVAGVLLQATPAQATFPGANGGSFGMYGQSEKGNDAGGDMDRGHVRYLRRLDGPKSEREAGRKK